MLDQSFSGKNFRIIFDISNRNGFFIEDKFNLTPIRSLTKEIKIYSNFAKDEYNKGNADLSKFFNEVKDEIRKSRDIVIDNVLDEISHSVYKKDYKVELKLISIPGGKDLYTIEKRPEDFFVLKQIQFNISRLFGVKQANRNSIVEQLLSLLSDKFPKSIIRTDISNFYESINHNSILKKVNQDNLLTPSSRRFVNNILNSYKDLSGSNKGVPRGIGISAYLAELYMREIDKGIRSLPGVTYYSRFVDDIIIVFTPLPAETSRDYLTEIKNLIEYKTSLSINLSKTFRRDINKDHPNCKFSYLGYEFDLQAGEVKTRLTNSKFNKIKDRLFKAFSDYENVSEVDEKLARKLLVKRIRFLTGNTRLVNNKSKILIGIFHSNRYLTEFRQLTSLDAKLEYLINSKISSNSLQNRLDKYSFKEGFKEKKFSPFTATELKEIMKIWK